MKKRINISTLEDLQQKGFFQKQEENDSSPDNQNIKTVQVSTPAINVDKTIKEFNELIDQSNQQIDSSRQIEDQLEDSLVMNNLRPGNPVEHIARQSQSNIFCSCKKSFCLKSYCECLKAGQICGDNCKCLNCCNDGELKRIAQVREQRGGCNCKKNHCMTNYCNCKKANNVCNQTCKCKSCYNDGEQVVLPLSQAN